MNSNYKVQSTKSVKKNTKIQGQTAARSMDYQPDANSGGYLIYQNNNKTNEGVN